MFLNFLASRHSSPAPRDGATDSQRRTVSTMRRWFLLALLGLGVGAHFSEAVFATARYASDGGRLTGSVTADGRAASGIWVIARQIGGRHALVRSAATGDDGRFEITDLPNGTYTITARKDGYVSQSESATPVYYRPGESATIPLIKGGVITGKVTDSDGAPAVAIRVAASSAPQSGGESSGRVLSSKSTVTDDRGIYRIYGLSPGKYLVNAGDSSGWPQQDVGYRGMTPTYYPSATVDTATAVEARSGTETTAIDIRFRGELGHAISGKLIDSSAAPSSSINRFVSVSVYRRSSATFVAYGGGQPPAYSFAVYGIPDGDYVLVATSYSAGARTGESQPLRVTVKGSDVSGLTLQLQPFGSMSGIVALQPMDKPRTSGCGDSRPGLLPETLVFATDESEHGSQPVIPNRPERFTGASDDKGQFEVIELTPGQYRLGVNLPDDEWYLRSIESAESPAPGQTRKRRVTHVDIQYGSAVKGLTFTIAQGAAKIGGRIKMPKEGQTVPGDLRVFLIPAETESAKDPFRYLEGAVESDGSFTIATVPPGKYRVLAKVVPPDAQGKVRHLSWKEKGRTELQQDATRESQSLELKACQRLEKYSLPFQPQPDAETSAKPSPSSATR